MKAMKKTIAVLLTVCMVVSMFALAAVTVSVGAATINSYTVTFKDDERALVARHAMEAIVNNIIIKS